MDIERILGLVRQGHSHRSIAKELGVSRNTLKRHFQNAEIQGQIPADLSLARKLDGFLPEMRKIMHEDPRIRATDLFAKLKEMGYGGGYDSVKRRIRGMRLEVLGDGYLAISEDPGTLAEVDFGRLRLSEGSVFLFSISLPYSGKLFARIVVKPDMESFLDCHERALHSFQGVPRVIAYQAWRNSWLRRLVGGNPPNLPLTRFAAHYGFGVRKAPYLPWAVGRMKRPLRQVELAFSRLPPFTDSEKANVFLSGWMRAREKDPSLPGREDSVAQRFNLERICLGALPTSPCPKISLKLAAPHEKGVLALNS